MLNFNSQTLDDLAARIGKAIEASPAKDIEKTVKSLLQSGLMRLDLVSRQEFDTQAQVLLRTREMVERLEARLAEMERRAGVGGATPGATPGTMHDASVPPTIAPAE
jgi:BMFP domain-containing protein YqiC